MHQKKTIRDSLYAGLTLLFSLGGLLFGILGTNVAAAENALPTQNAGLAEHYLEEAIQRGDPEAMRILAEELLSGKTLRKDVARAIKLLEEASAVSTEVQVLLGQIYLDGKDIRRDAEKGRTYFEKAAASGNSKPAAPLLASRSR